jgi:hypothetical protein
MIWAPGSIWKVFQLIREVFVKFGAGPVSWGGLTAPKRLDEWLASMVSWLSLKTNVEPGLRGSRVMSGDWQMLHRVRRVCSGSPENH